MSLRRAEVIVVGGGIYGASTLYHLARQGITNCLLVERGRIAGGPTGVSSAIVRQNYPSETYAKMALDSLHFFQRFTELTGGESGFRPIGYVAFNAPADLPALRATIARLRDSGAGISFVTTEELRRLEPLAVTDDLGGGAVEPEAGYADAAGTANGLVAWAVAQGAEVWRDTAVLRLLAGGGRVAGVETSRGTVHAERVVVAAGPWTARLALGVGVTVPTHPSRHPIVTFECAAGERPAHVIADFPNQIYLRPEGAGLLLAGALAAAPIGTDADPDAFDGRPTREEIDFFTGRALARFPALRSARSRGGWTGIYDMAPDRTHILDELPAARGCWVLCGTSGHGFKLAPAMGALATDLVLGREPAYDASMFRLGRFA